jgi:CHASE3 domain sensor protein
LLVVTGVVLGALISSVGQVREGGERARQGGEVSAIANRLERLVVDAESGTRGFVISGDEGFLRPYRAAQTRIPSTYNDLVAAIADPIQREQAMRIGAGVLSYLDEWAVPLVALTRERGLEEARRRVATAEGKAAST